MNWLISIRADIGQARHSELWHYEQALADIIDLLETQSERKMGKWLYDKYYLVHVCSECDEQALEEYTVNPHTLDRDYDEVLSEYCPHCGSRMLEIEDEDEDEEEEDD